jgi:GPH family glycoside/pentoside/hexuronide:cation symporter
MAESISGGRRLAYALGNAGYQITDRIVVSLAVYFYLPPAGRGLASQVPSDVFFGFLTVFGLAMLVGRLFDSAADPIVGHLSDRSRSPLGRRRAFLIYGVLPMVGLPVLLFWPPGEPGSAANGYWLAALLAAYFVAFTVYVAPFLALIPEIARSQDQRVRLARLLALLSFPIGAGFGTAWTLGYAGALDAGLSPVAAMRVVVVGASSVALLLCLAPILAVDERRLPPLPPSDLSLRESLVATLANRPFRVYLVAQLAMLFGVNLVQPALPYVATVLLGRGESYAAILGAATLVGTFAALPLATVAVRELGAKRTMSGSLVLFGVAALSLGGLDAVAADAPGDVANLALAFGVSAVIGIPVAGLLVVPHVLLSQLIDRDALHTGANRAAMYFGVQGFLTKWIYGVSLWALTYLLSRFGSSFESPHGVILVGPVAGLACLAAAALFVRYPEREILAALAQRVAARGEPVSVPSGGIAYTARREEEPESE